MGDPFAKYEEYAKTYETLGGDPPSPEEQAQRLARDEAYGRFRGAGGRRRFMAGARQFVGAMPLVRHIPPVARFSNPASNTEEGRDLQDYRTGMPRHSGVAAFLGRAAPHVAAGAALPGLFGNLPGAIAGNAGIGGVDAKLAGENPAVAGITEGLGTIAGWGMGRALTPRSRATSTRARKEYEDAQTANMSPIIDQSTDEAVALLRGIRGRNARGRFSTRLDPEAAMAQGEALEAGTREAVDQVARPPMQIPQIPSNANINQTAVGALLGTGIGDFFHLPHPWGAVIGGLAPNVRNRAIEGANAAIDRFNRGPGTSRPARAAARAGHVYFNNQVLSDEMRALLNALGGPAAMSAAESTRVPRLME